MDFHIPVERWRIDLFMYNSSAVVEMGDRLATIDMGRKMGDCFLHGSLSKTIVAWVETYFPTK